MSPALEIRTSRGNVVKLETELPLQEFLQERQPMHINGVSGHFFFSVTPAAIGEASQSITNDLFPFSAVLLWMIDYDFIIRIKKSK